MKTAAHKILVVFMLVAYSNTARAEFPSGWPLHFPEEVSGGLFNTRGLIKNKSSFVRGENNAHFIQVKGLGNKSYTACQFKKNPVRGIESILYWDFKLKFRLNRNMNIIFSYN